MKTRCLVAMSLLAGAADAQNEWAMTSVRSIQARVVSVVPVWDEANQAWVSSRYNNNIKTFADQYRATLDTVNTASVEGALMYVQSEGIDQGIVPGCLRKTNMSYVWFFDMHIVQPTFGVAQYATDTSVYPEYCPFLAMDNGMCTPTSGTTLPKACLQLFGGNGQPNIGPCIGGENRVDNPKAPYPDNVWFSFPGSCMTQSFTAKTDACRTVQKGGECPFGVLPDGVKCTYSHSILGYISLDDLVGITSLTNPQTSKPYTSRNEFCLADGVEYNSVTGKHLPFWSDLLNTSANTARSQAMIDLYASVVADPVKGANMKPLPSVASLQAANPPCYLNNPLCSSAQFGCRRRLLAQVCTVCTSPAADCVVRPAGVAPFPTLQKATSTAGSATGNVGDSNAASTATLAASVAMLSLLALVR
ncbi:hypothetical protein SPRG_08033 [Saprolegnia parasitica CBS 223.65]|uniref:Secreted protein n=1 Tax=Saprolegnia parasitica (strain CBS 223.65) TaxID=695850 RepID=A0A067C791_SAPPC|nr:hypothetical protein SPRG_08033 [Saprolegnia parasitica CBS 223.65]KDO26629.1 hypothetical protein SPRG_08033 [Saprolegnia parasitica CBS 223.65]|eukprot:XP_012202768.1 hypothetical protein SPRG_08033 [Saprolegnia parasitica CBS 223.65]